MPKIENLGLHGFGLIQVNTKEMRKRYNDCLADLALPVTSLDSFRIDAMGWSPDIARELGNYDYLSHGEANPLAIILTPDQRESPLYNPYHSYDWDLMKQIYDGNKSQVSIATQHEGICVDFNQHMDSYLGPEDLLLIDEICARIWTPSRIMEKVHNQKKLVRSFMLEKNSHHNNHLIDQLLSSRDDIGDMRNRQMYIPEVRFSNLVSFYTRALGGWFVLRDKSGAKEILVSKKKLIKAKGVTSEFDQELMITLEGMSLIDYDLGYWAKKLYRLRIIQESFLMEILDKIHPDMDYTALSEQSQKQTRTSSEVKNKLPEEYYMLEQVIRRIERGDEKTNIPQIIKPFLAHPKADLFKSQSEVVRYLLCILCDNRSVVRLYRYDKPSFFSTFNNVWKKPRQTWSIVKVREYYKYRVIS